MSSTMSWPASEVTVNAATEKEIFENDQILMDGKINEPISEEEVLITAGNEDTDANRTITEEEVNLLLDDGPNTEEAPENEKDIDELLGEPANQSTNEDKTQDCLRDDEMSVEDLLGVRSNENNTNQNDDDSTRDSDQLHIDERDDEDVDRLEKAAAESPAVQTNGNGDDDEPEDANVTQELVFNPNSAVNDGADAIETVDDSIDDDILMIEDFTSGENDEEYSLPDDVRKENTDSEINISRKPSDPVIEAEKVLNSVVNAVMDDSAEVPPIFYSHAAYAFFTNEVKESVMRRNPKANAKEVGQLISSEWKKLTKERKEDYESRAKLKKDSEIEKPCVNGLKESIDAEDGNSNDVISGSARRKRGFGLTQSEIRRFIRNSMDSFCMNRKCLEERKFYHILCRTKDQAIQAQVKIKQETSLMKAKIETLALEVQKMRKLQAQMNAAYMKQIEDLKREDARLMNELPKLNRKRISADSIPSNSGMMMQKLNPSPSDPRFNMFNNTNGLPSIKTPNVQRGVTSASPFPRTMSVASPSTSTAVSGKLVSPANTIRSGNIITGNAKTQIPLAARLHAMRPISNGNINNVRADEPLVKRSKGRPPMDNSGSGIYTQRNAMPVVSTFPQVNGLVASNQTSLAHSSTTRPRPSDVGYINGRKIESIEKRNRVNIVIKKLNRSAGKYKQQEHPLKILRTAAFIPTRPEFVSGHYAWTIAPSINVITSDEDFYLSKKLFGEVKYTNVPEGCVMTLVYYMKSEVDNFEGSYFKVASVFYPSESGRTKFCFEFVKDYEFWGDDVLHVVAILHTPTRNIVGKELIFDIPSLYNKIGIMRRGEKQHLPSTQSANNSSQKPDNSDVVVKEIPVVNTGVLTDGFEMYVPPP